MRRRTYFNMKLCGRISTAIVLQCLILQLAQGNAHPGLLAGLSGSYNLPQQVQLYQNQYFSPETAGAGGFDFFRRAGRFKLPQRRISFNRQDSLGYTFGQTQNDPQSLGFASPSGGTYQPVPETNVNKGSINLSSVASIGPTYATFVTEKEPSLPQVQPTQVPLSGIHPASTSPIVKPFSHPRFPFSSQGVSLFPNSQVVQNAPASRLPGGSSSGSLSFSQNANPTVSSLFNYNYFPQKTSSHLPQNYRRNYFNFPYNSLTSQSPTFNQNPSAQINTKPLSIKQYGQTQDAPVAPQYSQSPSPTVYPFTLQPSQSPLPQYPQQNSVSVSYLTNNQQSIGSNSPVTNLLPGPQPTPLQYQAGSNSLPLSSQSGQNDVSSKILATPAPVIYQQVKELPQSSITYQFNPDSSITPLQISKGDIPTLEDPKVLSNLVNRVAGSNSKVQTKNNGISGISNPLVFPTNSPAPQFPGPSSIPFQQNQLQPNSFSQNQPQGGSQQPNPQFNFPQGQQQQGNFPSFGPQGPNGQSFGPQGPNGQPFGPGGPNGQPFGPQGPNGPPFGPQGPNGQPFGPQGPNGQPFGPQGPNGPPFGPGGPNGPPPPELENGYNPNHLQSFPEPPYESEFLNLPPLEARDAAELEAYVRTRNSALATERAQGRRAPSGSAPIVFPNDEDNYRILNPTVPSSSPAPLAGLEEVVRVANGKPVPRECAYNTITQGGQGEDCIAVKKKK